MTTRSGSKINRQLRHWLSVSAGPALLLATSFVVFLKHNGYFYGAPEVVLCLTVVVVIGLGLGALGSTHIAVELTLLAALVTAVLDIQLNPFWFHGIGKNRALALVFVASSVILWALRAHAARLVRVATAAMFIATLVLPDSGATALGKSESPATSRRNELPLIVHLVLDSQMGVEGLADVGTSPKLASALQTFYTARGFAVFGGAYSEYATTEQSLAHLLNYSPGHFVGELVQPGGPGFQFALQRNAHFERFAQMGYVLHIYQPTYLDLCPRSSTSASCDTYRESAVGVIRQQPLSFAEKVQMIATSYLSRSRLGRYALQWAARAAQRYGVTFWAGNRDASVTPTAINSMVTARRVIHDLSKASGGELFFVHLLLPHSPYSYDADCRLRPLQDWRIAQDPEALPDTANSAAGRALRYAGYGGQVRCVLKLVQDVIDAVPAPLQRDSIVIVQGDHGSRIGLLSPPQAADAPNFNYWDWYSALFAVRSPSLAAGYESRAVPLPCLLRLLADSNFGSVNGLAACATAPGVFIPTSGEPVRQDAATLRGR